jgi:hypothetical protein
VALASRDDGGKAAAQPQGPDVVTETGSTLGSVPATLGPLGSPQPGPVTIQAVQELDPPPGDGVENAGSLGALTDGDPSTAWTTVCYESRYLYPKSGIGLVLGLSGPVSGQQLRVQWPRGPWRASVYTAATPGAAREDWGDPVAQRGSDEPGEAMFSLGDSDGRYVLLWLTQLAPSDACSTNPYQGAVGELAIEPTG